MNIPRWIKDHTPDESLQSRIVNLSNALANGTIDGQPKTDRELIGHALSELSSMYQKIEKTKEIF